MDSVKWEIDKINSVKTTIEENIKQKTKKGEDLLLSVEDIQNKRTKVAKRTGELQETIAKYAKLAVKSRVNLKGTEKLRKAEVYEEMLASYEQLVSQQY